MDMGTTAVLPTSLMPTAGLVQQAREAAKIVGLDPALVCAVVEQESAWNTWAVRFEPAFFARYIHPAVPSKPTTEQTFDAASFGLMQVMGEVARELGFKGVFLTELCEPIVGLAYGCKKLAACLKATAGDERAALLRYNGGGNAAYADQVLARVSHYTVVQ
jgi:soluble lytic murein transglycosylase-like protein